MKFLAKTFAPLMVCVAMAAAADSDSVKAKSPHNTAYGQKLKRPAKVQVGAASWYGKAFHGRLTASGEPYDMFQFTAASRTLPLGTLVKVTNLRNGKWVIVKVNDRGPYVGKRIMDLSYAAAQMLNFRARGIEKVRLEVIEPDTLAMADQFAGLD